MFARSNVILLNDNFATGETDRRTDKDSKGGVVMPVLPMFLWFAKRPVTFVRSCRT